MTTSSTPPTQSAGDVQVSYDRETNTITLSAGRDVTLAALSRALNEKGLLRELAPGEWLLSASLQVEPGVGLQIGGPEAWRLKLRSDPDGFVWIKVFGGSLTIRDACVTSWDVAREAVDDNYDDGRSFVLVRSGGQLRVQRSELSYLGYDAYESYGVALRLKGTKGEILESRLGYNFYGFYSYEASGLVIRDNEVHDSVRYGIDPHTRSNNLVIERNVSYNNGKHGIILAEECSNSIVRDNVSYNNALHGIVIYKDSNGNVVEDNTAYGNGEQGININNADDNIVRNNTAYDNQQDGIGVGQDAQNNIVANNLVYNNGQDGISLYSDAIDNIIRDNTVRDNQRYGIYVKSAGNTVEDNTITGNREDNLRENIS